MRKTTTATIIFGLALALCATACKSKKTGPTNCGNGTIETAEQCDGNNLGGQSCTSVGNFTGGTLGCTAQCAFDTSQCTAPANCGNGAIDTGEQCDGANLDGQGCTDVGTFTGGTLTCANDCSFDTGQCTGGGPTCPRHDLGSSTSVTYNGDTTGLPDLVTSTRLEWTDAPDDSLTFTAPSAGDYEFIVTAEPSSNGGCGASVWDYGTGTFYNATWCPNPGAQTEIDGFYVSAGFPYTFSQGETVLIWFSCTYWADVQSGAYTLTINRI